MKIQLLSILGIIACPILGNAQWFKLSIPTTKDLKTVYFLSNDLGYTGGKDGIMFKTTNGGTSWTTLSTSFGEEIKAMHFADANTGWIAGKDGKIKKTNDGGATWITQSSGTSKDINSIHFITASQGLAVGEDGIILITSNGGSTWTPTYLAGGTGGSGSDDDSPELYNVQLINATTAFISGKDGYFATSTNGGSSWTQQTSGTTSDLEGMHFTSASNGYVCYKTGGVRKTNGSGTFTSAPAATSKDLRSIYFITTDRGWTVGDEGRIQYTENSGGTWSAQNISSVTADLNKVHFPTTNIGFIAGDDGIILKYDKDNTPPSSLEIVEAAQIGIRVYPNPIHNQSHLHIDFSASALLQKQAIISAYNVLGQLVYTQQVASTPAILMINSSDWTTGMYHITIHSDNQISSIKIIK